MRTFRLPDIGEGLQEAEIVAWHVSPGDHVVADQPLVAIETDKAVVEIPSPWSGTIAQIHGAVGDIITVGTPLVVFTTSEGKDSGAIVGSLQSADHNKLVDARLAQRTTAPTDRSARMQAAPRVRAYASERGVDLSAISGSGPGGLILMADVDAAVTSSQKELSGHEPLKGPRRWLAINMAKAGRTVVPATIMDIIDISAWWSIDADITVRTVAAIVDAAASEPSLNAWFDGEAMTRQMHSAVNIGIAVDVPGGLFVPVIKNVGDHSSSEIRQIIDEFAEKARARHLSQDELSGATISLSNFGTIAGRHANLVLMPPQVAIVGIGRIEPLLALDGEKVVERHMLPISITFDHRAATGGEAARFLASLKSTLKRAQ